MTNISRLWLPIVGSAVANFLVSSVVHMLLPWHKGDYGKLAREDEVMAVLRPMALPPGDYVVPRPDGMADMRSPRFVEKLQKGPRLVVTVLPNGTGSMGRNLAGWFVYLLVVSVLVGGLAGRLFGPGTPHGDVFHVVAIAALLAYAGALWQMSIWYNRSWLTTVKSTIDGLVYALITAETFALLWPR